MTIPFFDLKNQYANHQADIQARLSEVFESQRFIMGPQVGELEETIAEFVGAPYAVGCASGTDAILLSMKVLDLEPGDEVITTAMTFFATAGAIVNAGGVPRFADVSPETLNLDPETAGAAANEKTKAVMPVHLFGQMAPMDAFLELGEKLGIVVVEDAAQAIGARQLVNGVSRGAGSVGTLGTFSFFPTKNLGAWGDGGMITTQDADLAERLRLLRVHGGAKRYHHDEIGTNSRLDTLQAAVLLAKFQHLDDWTNRRREHAAAYTEAFGEVDEITPLNVCGSNEHVFHQYTVRAEKRDELVSFMRERGVGCAIYYPVPLHLQPCFADLGYKKGMLPVTEQATLDVVSFPVFPELTDDQRDRVIETVKGFYS